MSFFNKGGSHVQSSPKFALLFCSCPQCWVSGRGVTTSSLSCSSSWTTTRSWRSLSRIGSTCSTGTPSSSMRVTLWALMGAGGNCHEHMQDTPLHFFAFLGFSPSRSVGHGPLRQQALFRTCLALFRDILFFFGGHFGSEVSCGSSMASASWASLRGGEPCSTLTQDTFTWFLPFPMLSNRTCLFCPAPSPDQQPSPPWSWHPSLEHDGGLCDVDQHILSGFLQLQVSYQAMYLFFARVVDIENDELRVSVLFACSSVRDSGHDELRVCLVFLLFRSAPDEFFFLRHELKQMAPEWLEAPFTTPSSC